MLRIPVATYRLQFNLNFTFKDAQAILPYLVELGVSDIYASPILKARSGSGHGYDVVDPDEINPELGSQEEFEALMASVHECGLGWLQDIVPNHMAFSSQNLILVDVLENGPESQYRDFFDINWEHPYAGMEGRLLAPFLGKFYGDCLENGELQLYYDFHGFSINYYHQKFPLKIETYIQVLTYNLDRLRQQLNRNDPNFVKLLGVLYALRYMPSLEEGQERYEQIAFIKRMLWEVWNESEVIRNFIQENIAIFNGQIGKPESFNLLDALISDQYFRLSYWKVGNEELNYRRFFTVNDLISVRVEREDVFNKIHALTLKLIKQNKITGLRVDHIDGLYDPTQYLNRLREGAENAYIVVEKILETNETLPINWPVQGTTGYDFLNQVNGLFCQQSSEEMLTNIYYRFIGSSEVCEGSAAQKARVVEDLIDQKKRLIIDKHMAGDIDSLAYLLKDLSNRYRYASDFTIYGLKAALVEVLAVFPVYRTYISADGASLADQEIIRQVLDKAKANIPNFLNELSFLEKFLLQEFDEFLSEDDQQAWLHFLMRLQQFTGPLMAKGVEDTVLYIYNRLLSLNEVGSNPGRFGISPDTFHAFNHDRAEYWPHAMSATSTHDTKRGEDVRARLNVISEIPQEWEHYLHLFQAANAGYKTEVNGRDVPDRNDEYFLYQTLLGTFPFEPVDYPSYIKRIEEYLIKAIREAKVYTAWLKPDTHYEEGVTQFAHQILKQLAENEDTPFVTAFREFLPKIQHFGILNSLSQVLLKLTVPGVPDFYQGTELWEFNLVDPDNRRPVDFDYRLAQLQGLKAQLATDRAALIADLMANPADARIKLFLIYQVLKARHTYQDVFQRGEYEKLKILGSLKDHVIAFARRWDQTIAITIVPRLLTSLLKVGEYPLGEHVWQETRICLPLGLASSWQNLLTGQVIACEETLWLREALSDFPVALLVCEALPDGEKTLGAEQGAGI
ncbi:malto-oligosyltrehalose synthase [Trichothermofontia sp.]